MDGRTRGNGRNMAWARAEIWGRLVCELDSLSEGIEENVDRTFDEFDRRRLAKAVKQIRKVLVKRSALTSGEREGT